MPVPAACGRCGEPLPVPTRRTYCAGCRPLVRTERNRANQQAMRARRLAVREGRLPAAPVAGLSTEQSAGLRDAVKAMRRSARDLTRARKTSTVWIAEVDPHLQQVADVLARLAVLLPDPTPSDRKDKTL